MYSSVFVLCFLKYLFNFFNTSIIYRLRFLCQFLLSVDQLQYQSLDAVNNQQGMILTFLCFYFFNFERAFLDIPLIHLLRSYLIT